MEKEKWFQRAAEYFSGSMPEEEMLQFEKDTNADAELSALMELWKETETAASLFEQNTEGAEAFISTHNKIKESFSFQDETVQNSMSITGRQELSVNTKQKNGLRIWPWLAAAAAITGIIFLGKMIFSSSSPKSNEIVLSRQDSTTQMPDDKRETTNDKRETPNPKPQTINTATLYAQAFTADDAPEDQNGLLDDAFFYYAMKEYKKAINAIDSISYKPLTRSNEAMSPFDEFNAAYYKALSNMCLGNTKAAIPLLQQAIRKMIPEEDSTKVQWYLALAFLKENKTNEAIKTLQQITGSKIQSSYKKKAASLLREIHEQ